jgi:hypothetical protein
MPLDGSWPGVLGPVGQSIGWDPRVSELFHHEWCSGDLVAEHDVGERRSRIQHRSAPSYSTSGRWAGSHKAIYQHPGSPAPTRGPDSVSGDPWDQGTASDR